jgi:hypothetical protein
MSMLNDHRTAGAKRRHVLYHYTQTDGTRITRVIGDRCLILAHVQWLTGDQAEHQILGIIRSLAYAGQAQPQRKKRANRDPREQKKN